jgi:GntR family transcriptional regulator
MSPRVPLRPRRRRGDRAFRVRDLLRSQIIASRYDTNVLPREDELMREYAATRGQVREALHLLCDEGFIERRQGTGTLVVGSKIQHPFDRVQGLGRSARRRPMIRGEMAEVELVSAPRPVAEMLGVAPGGQCAYVEFRTYADGAPFNINCSYLPDRFARVLRPGPFEGDFYEYLEAHGIRVTTGEMLVEAVSADEFTAGALSIASGAAVMLFRRLLLDPNEVPVELGFCHCRGDRLALSLTLPRHREEAMWLAS